MRFETIKKRKFEKVILILFVVITFTLILNPTKAKYRVTQSIPIAKGTISYSLGDLSLLGVYIQDGEEYTASDTIPESGYTLNNEKSYCEVNKEKDTSIIIEYNNGLVNFLNVSQKGTKCYLYFDEKAPTAGEIILSNMTTISERTNFSTTYTTSTTKTLFTAEDNDGTSYYFAGAPSDNWVKFGGFYWRIVRINGDGTIRLIYNGTSTTTTGTGTLALTNISYNSSYTNHMYVGYMYTSGEVHGYETSSTIKTQLDNWYTSNLSSYENYIDTSAGFCNDRVPYTDTSGSTIGGGTGTTATYYAPRIRIFKNDSITSAAPSFKCSDSNDLFTPSSSSKGNKKLTKPIGLITADEVAYAGAVMYYENTNISFYLYNNQNYWTISPDSSYDGFANAMLVNTTGFITNGYNGVLSAHGVRPVINLRADVTFNEGGTGTSTNPYVITGAE